MDIKSKNNKINRIFLVNLVVLYLLSNINVFVKRYEQYKGWLDDFNYMYFSSGIKDEFKGLTQDLYNLSLILESNEDENKISEKYIQDQIKIKKDDYKSQIEQLKNFDYSYEVSDELELIREENEEEIKRLEAMLNDEEAIRNSVLEYTELLINSINENMKNSKNIKYSFSNNETGFYMTNMNGDENYAEKNQLHIFINEQDSGGSKNSAFILNEINLTLEDFKQNMISNSKKIDISLQYYVPENITSGDDVFSYFSEKDKMFKNTVTNLAGIIVSIISTLIIFIVLYRNKKYLIDNTIYKIVNEIPIIVKLAIAAILIFFISNNYEFISILQCLLILPGLFVIEITLLSFGIGDNNNSSDLKILEFIKSINDSYKNAIHDSLLYKSTALRLGIFIVATLLLPIAFHMWASWTPWFLPSSLYWITESWYSEQIGRGYIGIYIVGIILYAFFLSKNINKITKGAKEISKGNYDVNLNVRTPYAMKELAESLNSINGGLKIAVENAVKSERLKGELITNVSHDLKTPLTSIINYVNLLQKDNLSQDDKDKYIEILDRKSQRLKILIEDLFEASKAASGNIELNIEKLDIVSLFRQTLGEFEDKIEESSLIFIKKFPKEKIYINADGRRIYRVFENITGNAIKYSLKNTRVYVEIKEDDEYAIIEMKNISAYPLDFDSDEILERFKRGDSSRNTEGSGLGLSIANSLIKLHGGTFEVKTDGDLFKVIIKINKVK